MKQTGTIFATQAQLQDADAFADGQEAARIKTGDAHFGAANRYTVGKSFKETRWKVGANKYGIIGRDGKPRVFSNE